MKQLDVDTVQIGNQLRSMEINEGKTMKGQDESEEKLVAMKERFDEVSTVGPR